ncbi:MAG TPA: pyridoxamine 5'-phosphate oxidase family protein [Acidimicrobiales bacterium]|nr:pyridoxamine 5'-phosphate oxidase family protein [Acidimicrobiales bacterium]
MALFEEEARPDNVAVAHRRLEVLSKEECLALLAGGEIGRLVYQDADGPAAVPVNYTMVGSDIVIRVEGGIKQLAMEQPVIAFEVDAIDHEQHSGWSVLARGVGREVDLEEVPELLQEMDGRFPTPWAEGVHGIWLRITPHTVTGRRLARQVDAPL